MRNIFYNRGLSRRRRLFFYMAALAIAFFLQLTRTPAQEKSGSPESNDTTGFIHALKTGKTELRSRYFFMATLNKDSLRDYFANAAGISIKYETAPFRRFQLGVGGSFLFNIGSSDLARPDPYTNAANRYESGLFDLTRPGATRNLYNLEYLYLKYQHRGLTVSIGKQLLNTPFINPQDGRMRPTLEDGVYARYNVHRILWEGGWLYHISPRSTVQWYTVANSIGLYPNGFDGNGRPASYQGQTKSAGIGLFGITYRTGNDFSFRAWEQYVDNVFNAWMLQGELRNEGQLKFFSGLRIIGENAVRYGGNRDPAYSYIQKGTAAFAISMKAGYRWEHWETALNYSRITARGRFLMPREWGVEPLYTFMYRERNEGAGDVNAFSWKLKNIAHQKRLISEAGAGYFHLPDVKDFRLNKYGMPSYAQFFLDIRYAFPKKLKGLELEYLYVYKKCIGESYDNGKFIINKVDLSNFNLILNYRFVR